MPEITAAEILYPDLDPELIVLRRYLERYPDGKGDWRPHEKSMALGPLATHIAQLPSVASMILNNDDVDVSTRTPTPPLGTAPELVALFEKNVATLKPAIGSATMADLEKTFILRFGNHVLVAGAKRALMRQLLINHLIHHRAQLGVYYRLLGIPVPSTYGPSADEPIGP